MPTISIATPYHASQVAETPGYCRQYIWSSKIASHIACSEREVAIVASDIQPGGPALSVL